MRKAWRQRLFGAALLATGALSAPALSATRAFEHVTVLSMVPGAGPQRDMTVTVTDGRITAIAPSAGARPAKGAQRIAAAGKYLMPALADMHVHLPNARLTKLQFGAALPAGYLRDEDIFAPFVANGVLQLLMLSATPETVAQRDEVESGRVLGPHVATAPMVDGSPPVWPVGMSHPATTPEEGRQTVRMIKADGYDFVKVYNRLDQPTWLAILDEANKLGIKVVGHIAGRGTGDTASWIQPGYTLIAHAEELSYRAKDYNKVELTDAEIAAQVALMKARGVWLIATLSCNEIIAKQTADPASMAKVDGLDSINPLMRESWLNPKLNRYMRSATPQRAANLAKIVSQNARVVKAFNAAGIPILAGTDAPLPGQAPGYSLHTELETLARAGLSNADVLQGATRLPAIWLGVDRDRGTVEVGKRADLILLDADPLADVANTRRIAGVVAGDRYLPKPALAALMAATKAHYATMKIPAAFMGAAAAGHWEEAEDEQ